MLIGGFGETRHSETGCLQRCRVKSQFCVRMGSKRSAVTYTASSLAALDATNSLRTCPPFHVSSRYHPLARGIPRTTDTLEFKLTLFAKRFAATQDLSSYYLSFLRREPKRRIAKRQKRRIQARYYTVSGSSAKKKAAEIGLCLLKPCPTFTANLNRLCGSFVGARANLELLTLDHGQELGGSHDGKIQMIGRWS